MLYALLAGSGLRVGEALGLEVRHVTPDAKTLSIEQSVFAGVVQAPKTKSAYRQVDLCTSLAEMLKEFIGNRKSGLVLSNQCGEPFLQTNILRRKFHPLLKELGIAKQGFHGARRLRLTWLRKQHTPDDLIRLWLGHSTSGVGDRYSKLSEDLPLDKRSPKKLVLVSL
jgi:integrase